MQTLNRALIIFSIILYLLGCDKPKVVYSKVWHFTTVIDTSYQRNKIKNPNIIAKVKGFYGANNIILDTTNNCYYYSYNNINKSDVQINESNSIPVINLTADQLVPISKENLDFFLNHKLKKEPDGSTILLISSPVDTISQESFKFIVQYVKTNNAKIHCGIRLTTEEENKVLSNFHRNKLN